ncbi:hypothetical protein ACH5RR_011929 [Cinchona calisaya]|uniref:Uncharacterized protein n=1 Tax=Cinchona calisaya TaxID=153742 RepID=A0ABD3A7W6_9GENT
MLKCLGKKNELLRRRREHYAKKKKEKDTALKSSSLKNQHNRSKDFDKKNVCKIGVQDIETGVCFTENDATQNELPQSNNDLSLFSDENLVEILDYCVHCGAKRFHLEPPNFCCAGGEVSFVITPMPYDLMRLYCGLDEQSTEFRKNIRTHNNSLTFTSIGSNLKPSTDPPFGIQLSFYDTKEELSRRLDASPRFRESTVKLLISVFGQNSYAKFFKGLRDIPNLENQTIILNSNPRLDQRLYNFLSSSQVAAIFTESDDQTLDKSTHIQNKELPMEQVHAHLKTKIFIAHIRSAKTRATNPFQCYTLNYYFEDIEEARENHNLIGDAIALMPSQTQC